MDVPIDYYRKTYLRESASMSIEWDTSNLVLALTTMLLTATNTPSPCHINPCFRCERLSHKSLYIHEKNTPDIYLYKIFCHVSIANNFCFLEYNFTHDLWRGTTQFQEFEAPKLCNSYPCFIGETFVKRNNKQVAKSEQ